jgi:predicted O-methyltransferase YrrM
MQARGYASSMTSREPTGILARSEVFPQAERHRWQDRASRAAIAAITWPWLLCSLWGGTKGSKRRLLDRLGLGPDALPNLGSWKADTGFLHRIVDAVEELRPATVVELGAGASTLVCAMALKNNGGGRLISYDQHEDFVRATAEWVRSEGAEAEIRHAPLVDTANEWPGPWYRLDGIPPSIDLLIIDGPPWAIHPFVRGAAESLFSRIGQGGIILLDDAARPGERIVARRWRRNFPDFTFRRAEGSSKGTLIGRKRRMADIVPLHRPDSVAPARASWRRAAAAAALLACGWFANNLIYELAPPLQAAEFMEEASASFTAGEIRRRLQPNGAAVHYDRAAIVAETGLPLPRIPGGWKVEDVQIYPSEFGISVALALRTEQSEQLTLLVVRAETPAEALPMLETRHRRAIAYWESGESAFALTGQIEPARVLALAARIAS